MLPMRKKSSQAHRRKGLGEISRLAPLPKNRPKNRPPDPPWWPETHAKRSPRACPAGPCRPRVGRALLRAPNLAQRSVFRRWSSTHGRSGSGWTHRVEPAFCCRVGGRALAWPVAPRLAQAAAAAPARAQAALAPSPPSGRRERRWERRRERRREAERWRRPSTL